MLSFLHEMQNYDEYSNFIAPLGCGIERASSV